MITIGAWSLLREAVGCFLSGLPGVREVHDLHIWPMSTTETALTVRLVRPGPADGALLAEIAHELHLRVGIDHATLQVEAGDRSCHLAPAEVV